MADTYLDACCFIYLVEGEIPWRSVVERRIRASLAEPSNRIVTSQLSRLECRSKPMRNGALDTLASYDRLFAASRVVVLDITPAVVDRATVLRSRFALKSPDALHLAAAIEAGAAVFVTGDGDLTSCTDIAVEVLAPAK